MIMNFPNDETGQVLAEMELAGIDLDQLHDDVFFHLFEKKDQAQAMVDFLLKESPEVSVIIEADETPNIWDVNCTIKMTPTHENILQQEIAFEKIASKFSGYNDGWGIEA
jgi:hypothetical protein